MLDVAEAFVNSTEPQHGFWSFEPGDEFDKIVTAAKAVFQSANAL